jgi:hypothetical protein
MTHLVAACHPAIGDRGPPAPLASVPQAVKGNQIKSVASLPTNKKICLSMQTTSSRLTNPMEGNPIRDSLNVSTAKRLRLDRQCEFLISSAGQGTHRPAART